jgi:thiopurine S-methyltransferase
MSNKQWKAKWKRNDISFHQLSINPLLQQFLPRLELTKGDCVLVPLCGKSVDLQWLAQCGFHVIGVELSEIAISSFFDTLKVTPARKRKGRFTCWTHENLEIWCGDIFDLSASDLYKVSALYDTAALTAFPATSRARYVRHLSAILPLHCQILLVTDETPEQHTDSVNSIDSELSLLFAAPYQVQLLYGNDCIKTDPQNPELAAIPMQEKVYLISRLDKE